jgi:TusA-related sulfurtransferase
MAGLVPEGSEAWVTVDARGRPCPWPIVALARAVREASGGVHLRLLATDPAVKADAEAWAEATGHALLSVLEHSPGEWAVHVRKQRA